MAFKMSVWIEIKKQEDVEYNSLLLSETNVDIATIDVFIGDDDFGNNYVSVPVKFIIKVLEENGYKI